MPILWHIILVTLSTTYMTVHPLQGSLAVEELYQQRLFERDKKAEYTTTLSIKLLVK